MSLSIALVFRLEASTMSYTTKNKEEEKRDDTL